MSVISNLNALTHDFLCQRTKLEQVVIERNKIKARYEDKFEVMEQVINELKQQLQHKRDSLTNKRVAVFQEKIHCLEEENDMLHEKLWRLKRRYVDKSVSTDELDGKNYTAEQNKNYKHTRHGQKGNFSSLSADSNDNSDTEVSDLLNEWKHKSIVLAEQKQQLAAKLQQLEDERRSESSSSGHVPEIPSKSFKYTDSNSTNFTPSMTIYRHDDEVFLPTTSNCPESTPLTEVTALESKCAGLPQHNDINASCLARRDVSRHCSSLDSLLPLNGRTVELFNSDDSYDPEMGLLNEHLYNLPDHKLTPAVRENLIHIRLTKYGDDVLTQSAPGRISLMNFVRDGGYAADEREETEAIDSFNFLKDLSEVSSEQGVYSSDGSP
ncbi:hypothetical protein LOD99_7268 [Oopsacas minuta]|uniref:Uncharacterized protein n=1 Tax=Oopsacas minuta TaxID=111878 RepID=A0AAV7JTY8_9METZ|nr:hypothetical protein LOD99_7268 [Oopsacas minuta]